MVGLRAATNSPTVALWWSLCCAIGVWLLAPSAAWLDSGELAGAAVTLGVPHPTGFPGFVLSGHTFARLPLGSAALRVHLLGLLAGAAGLWCAAEALVRTGRQSSPWLVWLPLVAPSLLLLPSVALHLRSTEVYPLVWLLVGAGLLVATDPLPRRLGWLGLLLGWSVCVHAEAALLVGALWLVSALQLRRTPRWIAASVALGLAGAAALAALPLSASRSPWLLWEQTDRWSGLVRHLTAAGIREAFADDMGTAAALDGWVALAGLLGADVGWAGALAGPGAVWLGVRTRDPRPTLQAWWPFVLVVGLAGGYAAQVNPMGLRDQQTGQVVSVAVGLLAWVGALGLLARLPVGASMQRVAVAAAGLAVVSFGAARLLQVQPATDLLAAPRLLDAAWHHVPPGAVLIAASDHQAGTCVWQQAAEGQRPDARCVPGVFLRNPTTLAHLARQTQWQALVDAAVEAQRPGATSATVLASWLRPALADRPVLWEPGLAAEDAQVLDHVRPSLTWSAVRQQGPSEAERAAAAAELPDAATRTCAGLGGDLLCSEAPQLAGLLASRLGLYAAHLAPRQPGLARSLLQSALQLAPGQPRLLHNRAVLALQDGDPDTALRLATAALERDPAYRRAHRTAARAAIALGELPTAGTHLLAALRGLPGDAPLPSWAQEVVETAPEAARAALQAAARGQTLPH